MRVTCPRFQLTTRRYPRGPLPLRPSPPFARAPAARLAPGSADILVALRRRTSGQLFVETRAVGDLPGLGVRIVLHPVRQAAKPSASPLAYVAQARRATSLLPSLISG